MIATEGASGLKAVALSRLQSELEQLQQHNATLSAENGRIRDNNSSLQQACDESLAKQSAVQLAHRQQVSELETAVHSLKQQLADACSSAEEQQAQVAAAREEVHAVLAAREQRCKDLRAEVAVLQKQLSAKNTEADGLARKVGAVNNLTSAFEQELEALQWDMSKLQERVAEQDTSLKQHEKRVLEVVQAGEELAEQLDQQGKTLQTTQQQLEEQQAANMAAEQTHTAAIQQLEQQLAQAQQDVEVSRQEVCRLEAAHLEQQDRITGLAAEHQQQLNALTEELHQVTAGKETAEAEVITMAAAAEHSSLQTVTDTAALQAERNAAVVAAVIACKSHVAILKCLMVSRNQTRAVAAAADVKAAAAAAELQALQEALAAAQARAEAAEEAEAVSRAEALAAASVAASATAASALPRSHGTHVTAAQNQSAAAAGRRPEAPCSATADMAAGAASTALGSAVRHADNNDTQMKPEQQQQLIGASISHHPCSSIGSKRPRGASNASSLSCPAPHPHLKPVSAVSAQGNCQPPAPVTVPVSHSTVHVEQSDGPPAVRRCTAASADRPDVFKSAQTQQLQGQQQQQQAQGQLVHPGTDWSLSSWVSPCSRVAGPSVTATDAGCHQGRPAGPAGLSTAAPAHHQQQQHHTKLHAPGVAVSAISALSYPPASLVPQFHQQQQQQQQQQHTSLTAAMDTHVAISTLNSSSNTLIQNTPSNSCNPTGVSSSNLQQPDGPYAAPAGTPAGCGPLPQGGAQFAQGSSSAVLLPKFVPSKLALQQQQQYTLQLQHQGKQQCVQHQVAHYQQQKQAHDSSALPVLASSGNMAFNSAAAGGPRGRFSCAADACQQQQQQMPRGGLLRSSQPPARPLPAMAPGPALRQLGNTTADNINREVVSPAVAAAAAASGSAGLAASPAEGAAAAAGAAPAPGSVTGGAAHVDCAAAGVLLCATGAASSDTSCGNSTGDASKGAPQVTPCQITVKPHEADLQQGREQQEGQQQELSSQQQRALPTAAAAPTLQASSQEVGLVSSLTKAAGMAGSACAAAGTDISMQVDQAATGEELACKISQHTHTSAAAAAAAAAVLSQHRTQTSTYAAQTTTAPAAPDFFQIPQNPSQQLHQHQGKEGGSTGSIEKQQQQQAAEAETPSISAVLAAAPPAAQSTTTMGLLFCAMADGDDSEEE